MKKLFFYINLIWRKLNRQISDQEQKTLEQWIARDPENKRLFEQYKKIYELSGLLDQRTFDIDTKKEYQKLLIYGNIKRSKIIELKYYISAAAALILILFALWFLFTPQKKYYASQNMSLILSDSTQVILRTGSEIKIARLYPFWRKVYLQGEAFFSVKRLKEKKFTITTKVFKVRVLGTKFLVNTQTKSIIVQSGSVKVLTPKTKLILKSDQKATILNSHQIQVQQVQAQNYLAWHTGKIVFNDADLQEVVDLLQDIYGKKIIIADETLKNLRLTAEFDRQSLEQILEVIRLTLNLKIKYNPDSIVIKQ